MKKRGKKKKGGSVNFRIVSSKDENGNIVQYFVPEKYKVNKNDPDGERRVENVIKEFCRENPKPKKEEDDIPEILKNYEKIKENLTKEEQNQFSVDGMFPNDGFNYSQYVVGSSKKIFDDSKNEFSVTINSGNEEDNENEVEIIDDFDESENNVELDKELFDDCVEVTLGENDTIDFFFDETKMPNVNKKHVVLPVKRTKKKAIHKKKKVIDIDTVKSKVLPEKKHINEVFQKMLSTMDDDLFGGEFDNNDEKNEEIIDVFDDYESSDEEDDEKTKGVLNFVDVEATLDEFIKKKKNELPIIPYCDANHENDGKITKEDVEEYSKNAPEGMMVLNEKMKKKLRAGDIDHKEIGEIILKRIEFSENNNEEEGEEERTYGIKKEEEKDKYDAESIISTYSNLENHPNVIKSVGKKKKMGIGIKEKEVETVYKKLQKLKENEGELKFEKKNISKEEKKKKKKLLKLQRKKKRELKKSLKQKYNKEFEKQKRMNVKNIKKINLGDI